MTGTEIVVVIGGLVVGYWIVAVVLPMLGRTDDEVGNQDAGASEEAADAPGLDADTEGDEPTVRREM